MPLSTSLNLTKLFLSLTKTDEITKPIINDLDPEKPYVNEKDKSSHLLRVDPESMGIKLEYIQSFINEVENDDTIIMNRFMLIKDDKVLYEYVNKPYDLNSWNACFSLTKTTVGLAIGMLYDEGKIKLTDKAYDILLDKKPITNPINKTITIEQLLTMSTGIKFNESTSAVSKTWIKDIFNSGNKFKPGTSFEYNSLNTYILSAIVKKVSGQSLSKYLKKRLFDPLEIKSYYYSLSPENIECGGWGLYITPEAMAKLGILIKNDGVYNGVRLISKEWIDLMSHERRDSKNASSLYNYGYQMWANDKNNICLFNGLFDQDIVIYRNTGIVCVWCCSNSDAFHTNNIHKIAEKYFSKEIPIKYRKVNAYGYKETINDETLMHHFKHINGYEFIPLSKKANGVSILPIFIQATMSTFLSGFSSIRFSKDEFNYYMHFTQKDESYDIPFNFEDGIRQTIKIYGNSYDCNVDAKFKRDDEDYPYLLIRICFLEFASDRFIKIHFTKKRNIVTLSFSENPSRDFVLSLIDVQDDKTKRFLKSVSSIVSMDTLYSRLDGILTPHFDAERIKYEDNSKEK